MVVLSLVAIFVGAFPSDASVVSRRLLMPPGEGAVGFESVAPISTGIQFTNRLTEAAGAANRVLENGSGVALGDVNGDGRLDIFLCGLQGNSALYLNLGNWTFRETTQSSGLTMPGESCRGAVFADLNGDRQADLLVSTLANGVRCFLNQSGGRFVETTVAAGTGGKPGSTTMALADVDGNGTLDLYVTRYRADDIRDNSNVEARVVQGRTEFHPKYGNRLFMGPGGMLERGEPDVLYLNDGRGAFREVSWTEGVFLDEFGQALKEPPRDWGLSAAFQDMNGDGLPDLYVCNDYWTPDRLWIHIGGGRFRAAPKTTLRQMSENAMGVDFADIDRDGDFDFLVLDMLSRDLGRRKRQALAQSSTAFGAGATTGLPQVMRNSLYLNRGDGSFAQAAAFAGLAASDWSWQPLFLDVDLDGFEDVVISAGHRKDVQDLDATERIRSLQRPLPGTTDPAARQRAFTRDLMEHGRIYPGYEQTMIAFQNSGRLRFQEKTKEWGFEQMAVYQGMAAGDLDEDGDLDLVVNRLDDGPALFRNRARAPRIVVRLQGLPPNSAGIGAEVRLRGGAQSIQSKQVMSGGRYLSGCDTAVVLAAGESRSDARVPLEPLELIVRWPSGRQTRIESVEPGYEYTIEERVEVAPSIDLATPAPRPSAWFEEVSSRLQHVTIDSKSDEPAAQPRLPRRLGNAGAGVAWFDLNRDGWDDLILGTGVGGKLGVFTNEQGRTFRPFVPTTPEPPAVQGTAAVLAFRDGTERTRLLETRRQKERSGSDSPAMVDRIWGTDARMAIPGWGASPGTLAMADVDGDGDLDLFIGGQAVDGRYPDAGRSRLLYQESGGWREDAAKQDALHDLGWVNAAVWGDLDNDGDADLVVACEWGPLRVLTNESGHLRDVTDEVGMGQFRGWWMGVALGDFDRDGELDIVGTNLGGNGSRQAEAGQPAGLWYADFSDRGMLDLFETTWDTVRMVPVPRHGLGALLENFPSLRTSYPSHTAFSTATAEDVLGALPRRAIRKLEATVDRSAVFLRRGNVFEAIPLPEIAQLAPAWSVAVGDFDLDGREDLFLAQNDLYPPDNEPPMDAGLGLVLKGKGDGKFEAMEPVRSGIHIPGDARGAAVADFDRDGRLDLVITEHSGPTRLYRNAGTARGVRIRLHGERGNRDGIGVFLRIREGVNGSAGPWGPIRVVTAGVGYQSQSSATQIFPMWDRGAELWVRWPGKAAFQVALPSGAKEVVVGIRGTVTLGQ